MNAETTRPSSLHCKNMYVASEIAQNWRTIPICLTIGDMRAMKNG